MLTGLLYLIYGALTGHFRRNLFPAAADLSPRALAKDCAKKLRFARPDESEAHSYNALQRITYVIVIFVLFPLVIWTGLAMSLGFDSAFPIGGRVTRRPAIRAHAALLRLHRARALPRRARRNGLRRRFPQPHARHDHRPPRRPQGAPMNKLSRRKLIQAGIATAAGVSGVGVAAHLAQKYGLVPPDHRGIWGLGESLTYATQRLLTRHSLAREFPRSMISKSADGQ